MVRRHASGGVKARLVVIQVGALAVKMIQNVQLTLLGGIQTMVIWGPQPLFWITLCVSMVCYTNFPTKKFLNLGVDSTPQFWDVG